MELTYICPEGQDKIFKDAAAAFFATVRAIKGDHVVVGLPGGRSIVPFLRGLINNIEMLSIKDWQRLQFFMLDERGVPLDSDESNFKTVYTELEQLVQELIVRKSQVHPFLWDESLDDKGAAKYQEELEKFGGKFDIAVLGAGEDGHVAGIFPNHPSLEDTSEGFITFDNSPKPPAKRFSASLGLLKKTTYAFSLFIGEGKREALLALKDPDVSLNDCPAKLIYDLPVGYVITDQRDLV